MSKKRRKKAFTLAEIMIVLTVIGVLTAILLPVAFQAAPDENVLKFKKANTTLGTAIRELVNSDKYYSDGDLGKKPDGTAVEDAKYFCESLSDILSTKEVNCQDKNIGGQREFYLDMREKYDGGYEKSKTTADEVCKKYAKQIGAEIVMADGVIFYQISPKQTFGISWQKSIDNISEFDGTEFEEKNRQGKRLFSSPDKIDHADEFGFDPIYKTVCIDVDGIEQGEDPFGYGIRADGKIFLGKRAGEWLNKSVQQEPN